MKNTFLTGSFLPGYSTAFRYNRPGPAEKSANSIDKLASRFYARAGKMSKKGKGYVMGIQIGLAVSLLLVWTAFKLPLSLESELKVVQVQQELVTMEEIQQTTQQTLPPPPPRPIVPVAVPDDVVVEDLDLDLDVALELDEAITDLAPPPAVDEEDVAEPEIFMVVENMPKIKGGMASLLQAVEYPTVARKNGIEGNVIVKIVVDEEGNPLNPVIVRSPSPLLEEAALKAVMKQRFEPGRQRGRAVKVEVVIPVKFRLTS